MAQMIRCISPVDGSVYAERPALGDSDVQKVVSRARKGQRDWARRSLAERIALVQDGIRRLGEADAEAVPELAWMMGRPVRYGGEFRGVNERSTYMAGIAEAVLKPTVVEAGEVFERRLVREALGVGFVIAPWNYPYMTAINSVVPALIAGNAVILKPSSQTPLVGERLERAFREAGVPGEVFQNAYLSHETTLGMISARSVDFVNFTGSVGAGRLIEGAAAGTFLPVGLELGGKDGAYVRADADLDGAVAGLMDAAMYNSGQSCCGIERIYVAEALFDEFVAKSVELVSGYVLGSPLDEKTSIGPMAHRRFADVARKHISEAVADGARGLVDPALFAADDGKSAYLAPQILVDVNHSMTVMVEETFGPVVGIMPVKDDGEAIRLINDSVYGLTASIWTSDADAAAALGSELEVGTVFMNRADYVDPGLCWSGCKNTGKGGTLSEIGYYNVTRPKSYHLKKG